MFKFPSTTYVHKELKVQDIFKRMGVDPAFKRQCSGIKSILLENVLNPKRMNIASKELKELYVFLVLTDTEIPNEFFQKLDRLINPSIQTLYCIQSGPVIRYVTAFRHKGGGNLSLARYIKTDWMTQPIEVEIPLVDSLDLIYLRILSNFCQYKPFKDEDIANYVARTTTIKKLDEEIENLEKAIMKEVQSKKKFEFNAQLRLKKAERESLTDEGRYQHGKITQMLKEYSE